MSLTQDRKDHPFSDECAGALVTLCRGVLVANLERYPPEYFAMIDELEWEALIALRHKKTRPQKGNGGLDGTGRMNPCLTESFLSALESDVPHLARSEVVDKLVWKDVVEFKFKAGGLSRPKELLYPWPVLEAKIEISKRVLLDFFIKQEGRPDESKNVCLRAIEFLRRAPMDVSLLASSGIGKIVSKVLKKSPPVLLDGPLIGANPGETPRRLLKQTLDSWMALAANSGVAIRDSTANSERTPQSSKNTQNLEGAKKCKSWRELFALLKAKDEEERSSLGARMYERKKKLDQVRPKIVKVRHASSRQRSIIDGRGGTTGSRSPSLSASSSRMVQLRQQARVTSTRRGLSNASTTASLKPVASLPGAGFGAAVAYASGQPMKKRKLPGSKRIELAGGRRMKIPASKKANENMKRLATAKKGTKPALR